METHFEDSIYYCDPDDIEAVSSEFDREVDSHYYSMKEKFETIAELLTINSCKLEV